MICTTIQNRDFAGIVSLLERRDGDRPLVEMAEIRLDSCPLSMEEIQELFAYSEVPLIATCRVASLSVDDTDPKATAKAAGIAESRLMKAIEAGADYVDIELEAPAMMSKRLRREAQEYGTCLIRSYHDYSGTDSVEALKALTDKCLHLGAEIVKIVTSIREPEDAERLMSLYKYYPEGELVAFCMGEEGRDTRIECLRRGSPWTYAAPSDAEAAAPGQMSSAEMNRRIYGDRKILGYSSDSGTVHIPCSKSFAQRAILMAALAKGESALRGYSPCDDNVSAISVARAIGAEVKQEGSTLKIRGIAAAPSSLEISTLHTGESGLLTRMMIPILAATAKSDVIVTGEKTLLNRPLTGAKEIMSSFGVSLENTLPLPGKDEIYVPLKISATRFGTGAGTGTSSHSGGDNVNETVISGASGSQIVSGLVAALPLMRENSTFSIDSPKSIPYIFITVDVLNKFGIRMRNYLEGGEDFVETQDWNLATGMTFEIKGGQRYSAADLDLEADWSSAANILVAGAIFGKASVAGLDTKSLQADLTIMDILTEAGASLTQDEEGVIYVQRAPLRSFAVDASNCPDLFPIISILAAFCEGTSKIKGLKRLAGKESDRANAITDMLAQMGVEVKVSGDSLIVKGKSYARRILAGDLLKGGYYTSRHDHRMAMALKVADYGADSSIVVDDTDCVSKSFPTFYQIMDKI